MELVPFIHAVANIKMIRTALLTFTLLSFFGLIGQNNVQLDIPTFNNGLKGHFYESIRKSSEVLNLEDLQKGVDSLEIRIWFFYSKRDQTFGKVHIYRYDDNWIGKASYGSSILVNISPKSGWKSFISKLLKKNIMTLQNQRDIKGFNLMIFDGDTYCVEIATRDDYRFYSYNSPDMTKKYRDAKKMNRILKLVKREF